MAFSFKKGYRFIFLNIAIYAVLKILYVCYLSVFIGYINAF